MKRLRIIPLASVILAMVLAVSTSSFTTAKKDRAAAKDGLTTYYFKYKGTAFDADSYLTPGDWEQRLTSPGDDCTGDDFPCVIHADLTNNTVAALVSFLDDQGDDEEVEGYVENPANIDHERSNP